MSGGTGARFTDIFIRRPVLATVVSLLILALGAQAFIQLQLRQYPRLTKTAIRITTAYPGADAELVRGFVTAPLQRAVSSTEGVDFVSSVSTRDRSVITVDLRLNADGTRAMADVLTRVSQVRSEFPAAVRDPVVMRTSGEDSPLMFLDFHGKTMSQPQITDLLTRVVQPMLQAVEGVGEVQIGGSETFAMRVWLDPRRMAAMKVTAGDVVGALRDNNFLAAAGSMKGDYIEIGVHADTDLDSPEGFGAIVVRAEGERLIRLRDIAEVELAERQFNQVFYAWDEQGVYVTLFPAPGSNALDISARIVELMPEIQKRLPGDLVGRISRNFGEDIRDSIDEVIAAIAQAAAIVVVVVFLFLGNARAMLIPIAVLPLSLVGVMFPMYLMGYSINLFTLLALVLAIGLVVDDAIVVVENIHRHIEAGLSPRAAALRGARELAAPVIAMTLTLAAVYAPIGFLGGLTGTLFREFAYTLAAAVVISGIVALTLSPMLASRLLKAEDATEHGGIAHLLDRAILRAQRLYQARLGRVLAWRPVVLVAVLGLTGTTVVMFVSAPRELTPREDFSGFNFLFKAPPDANLDYLLAHAGRIFSVIKAVPETTGTSFLTLSGEPNGVSRIGVAVRKWRERERSVFEILPEAQKAMDGIAGLEALGYTFSNAPADRGGPPLQFTLKTTAGYENLYRVTEQIRGQAMASGRFAFLDSDLRFDTPQLRIGIDRAKANQLGISMAEIGRTFSTLLGNDYVNLFAREGQGYQVIPQAPRALRLDEAWLGRYHLRSASGAMIPASTVIRVSRELKPNALSAFQQLNAATLKGVPAPGQSLGDVVGYLRALADETMPEGFSYDFQGQSRQYVQEGTSLTLTFGFALVVIFLFLAAQFESWRDPFIILAAVPLTVFGALLPVTLGASTLNIYTQVGLVTLIGLISKHGILMVDFANRLLADAGLDRHQAFVRAAGIRMRPILMTTSAMAMGTLPLITASGAGAESRFALGVVIASGISIGTVFTLFVVPVVYTLVARRHDADRALLADEPA
ncbi:MAG: efflux RND transporter permease subunit [Gammaproteobacteria bacterium]